MAYDPMQSRAQVVRFQDFMLSRFRFACREYGLEAVGPMLLQSAEACIAESIDRFARGFVYELRASCVEGEKTLDTRHVEYEYTFPVFASWWDHLKHSIRERRVLAWLPRRWTNIPHRAP